MPIFEGTANDTVVNGASIATPAASASIVSSTVPQTGIYEIEAQLVLSGTAETQNNNALLTAGGITAIVPTVTGVTIKFRIPRVRLVSGAVVKIAANSLATTGAVYSGFLTVCRVG